MSTASTGAATRQRLTELHEQMIQMRAEYKDRRAELSEQYEQWFGSLTINAIREEANSAYWTSREHVGAVIDAYRKLMGHGFRPQPRAMELPCLNTPICPATVEHECSSWTDMAAKQRNFEQHKNCWDKYLGLTTDGDDADDDNDSD